MSATGIGRVSLGAFLGRCIACEFTPPSPSSLILYIWFCICMFASSYVLEFILSFGSFSSHVLKFLFSCCDQYTITNIILERDHVPAIKSLPFPNFLWSYDRTLMFVLFPSHRLVLHHDLAFPVEGVRHHTRQLSSSLHNQIPEAQIFTTKLLQALLMSQTGITFLLGL